MKLLFGQTLGLKKWQKSLTNKYFVNPPILDFFQNRMVYAITKASYVFISEEILLIS